MKKLIGLVNRFKVFEFNEADERVHSSSTDRLRRLSDYARKVKKLKHKNNRKFSPVDKYTFINFFTGCAKAQEIEISNEPTDVDSKDRLDTGTPQKKNYNEAIDLDAEDSRGSKTIQDKICSESTDVDTEVKHSANSAEKDLTNGLPNSDACCEVCITPENCASNNFACLDHFVSGNPVAGGNFFPARFPNYQVTTPCSENVNDSPTEDVSINTISDDDDDDERTEMSSSCVSSSKQNAFMLRGVPGHDFGRHFHKLYPKGEHDVVAISQEEIELLQPERFINDNIIDFYINHLKNNIELDERERFHFFNCFFFRKLADLDKKPFTACEGRAAFERVRKWTKEVNLFEKDYIFIPINFKFHWSLVVVCHPGEVVTSKDEEVEISPKVPCILHMDSIKGSHRGLRNLFQIYLSELWKEKHDMNAESISSKFLQLKFIQLELPQQENWYDCGLFLLHYVELFLREAPANFNPFIIRAQLSNFLSKNWFPPAEASRKRAEIRELINGIFENGSQEVSQADCSIDRYSSSQLSNKIKKAAENEIVEEICQSTERCHVSTPRSVKCTRESGLFSNRFLHTANTFSGDKYSTAACLINRMPSIEELEEEDMDSGSSSNSIQCQNASKLEEIEDGQCEEVGESSREHEVYVVEDSEESDDSPYEHEMYLLRPRMNCRHSSS